MSIPGMRQAARHRFAVWVAELGQSLLRVTVPGELGETPRTWWDEKEGLRVEVFTNQLIEIRATEPTAWGQEVGIKDGNQGLLKAKMPTRLW